MFFKGFIVGLIVAFVGSAVLSIFIMSWLRFGPRITKESKRRFYPWEATSEERK